MNNASQDCTPYILSALHCGDGASVANRNNWIFYFNYESNGCSSPNSEGNLDGSTIVGCKLIADSNDGGGDTGSDFLLIELNSPVPESYNPYYAGWRANNIAATSGVSIHHPSGDIKKISTFASSLISESWGGVNSNTHWGVTWVQSTNGHGVTEGGSSGSPIFNQDGYIVGTLTGGSSFCSALGDPDSYGKMSYHWTSNGGTPQTKLKDWLDPNNDGVLFLSGADNPCAVLDDCDDEDLVLSGNIADDIYSAYNNMTITGFIPDNGIVTTKAGECIEINGPFETGANVLFEVIIANCHN